MVESLEANAHGAGSLAAANQADTFDDAVAGFGDHGEADNNQRCRFDGFSARGTISAGRDGPFGHDTINILRDPPTDLFDRTDSRDDFTTDEREPFDCLARVG